MEAFWWEPFTAPECRSSWRYHVFHSQRNCLLKKDFQCLSLKQTQMPVDCTCRCCSPHRWNPTIPPKLMSPAPAKSSKFWGVWIGQNFHKSVPLYSSVCYKCGAESGCLTWISCFQRAGNPESTRSRCQWLTKPVGSTALSHSHSFSLSLSDNEKASRVNT